MKNYYEKLKSHPLTPYLGLVIAVAVAVHWRWFFTSWTFTDGDWYAQFPEALQDKLFPPQLWNPDALGSVDLALSAYPFHIISAFLSEAGAGYWLIQRLVFMWPIALLSAIGSFFLVRYIVKNNIAAVVGSFVFSYNTYFLLGQTGHLTLMASFALAPLTLLLYFMAIDRKDIRLAIISGLLAFAMSFLEFRALYILVWIILFYLMFELVTRRNSLVFMKERIWFIILPGLLVLALNVYWLVPLSTLKVVVDNQIFSRGLFGNDFLDVIRSFTLAHPFWSGAQPTAFFIQPIPWYNWFLPILAVGGMLVFRQNRRVAFFAFIALVGIFLAKQVGGPFGQIYAWLYENFPGFSAYREASKFFFVVALGYAILIGSLVAWIVGRFNSPAVKASLILAISFLLLANTTPLINGKIKTLFIPREPHPDYEILRKHLSSDDNFYRTLWVPRGSRWSFYSNAHPRLEMNALSDGAWRETLPPRKIETTLLERSREILLGRDSQTALNQAGIRYVIVPVRDGVNDEDFFRDYDARSSFVRLLDEVPYLERVDIGTQELAAYENRSHFSYVQAELPDGTLRPMPVRTISPTRIEVDMPQEEVKRLFISHIYHPNWELRYTSTGQPVPSKNEKTVGATMVYTFDEPLSNKDVSLSFAGQGRVNSWGKVNLMILAASLLTLIWLYRRKNVA